MNLAWLEFETARFEMGSDRLAGSAADDEGPTRQVTVGSMAISECILVEHFSLFVEATGYRTTAETEGTGWVARKRPDAGAWVAGAHWRVPDGSRIADPATAVVQVSWYDCQEFCRWSSTLLPTEAQWARAVDASAKPAIWQWCADFYHPTFHRDEQRVNPTGPIAGTERVLRGGSTVITERAHHLPDFASNQTSFRAVRART